MAIDEKQRTEPRSGTILLDRDGHPVTEPPTAQARDEVEEDREDATTQPLQRLG